MKIEKTLISIAAWVLMACILPAVGLGALAALFFIVPVLVILLLIVLARTVRKVIAERAKSTEEIKRMISEIKAQADLEQAKAMASMESFTTATLNREEGVKP